MEILKQAIVIFQEKKKVTEIVASLSIVIEFELMGEKAISSIPQMGLISVYQIQRM